MITAIYIIILTYFFLGAVGFYLINRKKTAAEAHQNRVKFGVYFLIINILFFSIVINPAVFRLISILIVIAGFSELYGLFKQSGYDCKKCFIAGSLVMALFSAGFFVFSGKGKELILFTFLILSIFDSFSQISGQLWGKRKILPRISPRKTTEGTLGGAVTALLSSVLLRNLTGHNLFLTLWLASGIVVFAFAGDLLASLYKRKYKVKDFSNLIPGHGGFLDRFDSLIAGGTWIALTELIFAQLNRT